MFFLTINLTKYLKQNNFGEQLFLFQNLFCHVTFLFIDYFIKKGEIKINTFLRHQIIF